MSAATKASSVRDYPYHYDTKLLETIDTHYIALIHLCNGDLRTLMDTFFHFLNRRTDYYIILPSTASTITDLTINDNETTTNNNPPPKNMGFREGDAERMLLASFRKYPLRKIRPQQPPSSTSSSAALTTTNASATVVNNNTVDETQVNDVEINSNNEIEEQNKSGIKVKKDNNNNINNTLIRYTENGLQIPIGNGGITNRYHWTQTLEECTVSIPIPSNDNNNERIRAKDLNIVMKSTKLVVQQYNVDDKTTTSTTSWIDGTLFASIIPNESSWIIEDNNVIMISLYKKIKTFWKTIMVGDVEIDTSFIDSKRHIQTYDNATQSQIRKIIYEQNQEYIKKNNNNNNTTSNDDTTWIDPTTNQPIPPPPPSFLNNTNEDIKLPDGCEYITSDKLSNAAATKK